MRTRRRFSREEEPELALITSMSLVPLAAIFLIVAVLAMSAYGIKPHAVTVDLPPPGAPSSIEPLSPPANLLSITRSGEITWNSQTVSTSELQANLRKAQSENPQPALNFAPAADAAYGDVTRLMDTVRQAGLIDACFIFSDTWRYRRYEETEPDSDPQPAQQRGCTRYYGY